MLRPPSVLMVCPLKPLAASEAKKATARAIAGALKNGASDRNRTYDKRFTKPLLEILSHFVAVGQISQQLLSSLEEESSPDSLNTRTLQSLRDLPIANRLQNVFCPRGLLPGNSTRRCFSDLEDGHRRADVLPVEEEIYWYGRG
jgi:hypothetical protein